MQQKQTQIAEVCTEISWNILKHELQFTLFWDISANFSFCRLAKGRQYSAYVESDCFAGTADDIGTNHSKPRLNSGDNNFFFRTSFLWQKGGQAKHAYRNTLNRDIMQFYLCFRIAFLAVILPLTSGEHRFLSVMSIVAQGFPPRSRLNQHQYQKETRVSPSGFVLFLKVKCI